MPVCEGCGAALGERLDAFCAGCVERTHERLARLLVQAQQPFGEHLEWATLLRELARAAQRARARGGPDGATDD